MSRRAKNYDVLPALSIRGPELRKSLRILTFGWMFGSVWMVTVGTAAMLNVGYLAGFTEVHWGVLSSTMYACTLAQLPASWIIERTGMRKSQFLRSMTVSRSLWLLVGAAPLMLMLLPASPTARLAMVWVVLGIVFCSRTLDHVGSPAWINWMADLIPARIRGRVFGRRGAYSIITQLAATVVVGCVLDWATPVESREALRASLLGARDVPVLVWALLGIFAFAAACGVVDVRLFARVREIIRKRPPERIGFWQVLREPMADRQFIHFAGAFATLAFGVGLAAPFVALTCQKHLNMNNLETMVILAIVPPIGGLLSSKPWGFAIDRWGRRPIMILTMAGTVWAIWGWLFVPPSAPWLACIPVMIGGVVWQGLAMSRLNMELAFADQKGRSTYTAAANVVSAFSGTLGGLVGGATAAATRDLNVWIGPFSCVNYHVVFLLSGTFRILAVFWLVGMADANAKPVKQVARHMAMAMFYSAPVRLIQPVRRLVRPSLMPRRRNGR